MNALDDVVIFDFPGDWTRLEIAEGTVFARSEDLGRCGGDFRRVPLTFFSGLIDALERSTVDEIADALMQRRVRQGYPERFSTVISTLDARGFAWTDGVVEILSFFVEHPSGVVVEFQVGRWFGETGSGGPPLRPIADELLTHVRWRDVHAAG